jgi:anti-sigma factor RsiW
MHCSSFKPLLDGYVDGELSPVQSARVSAHAERCARCSALLTELRVIDGLLLEPRRIELAPNFTFRVMAEARCLHAPRQHRSMHLPVLATYIVFAWVAIAAFMLFGGNAARSMIATIGTSAVQLAQSFAHLSAITGLLFGRQSFDVTAAMGGVIALDLLGAALVFVLYAVLRTRRAELETSDLC